MPPSDSTMTIEILRQSVRTFIEARDWDQFHTPKDLSIGLIIEAGELLEHFRFRNDAEISAQLAEADFLQHVSHELADVLFFLLALSHKLNLDLAQALDEKMAISAQRYPVEKARGKNLKYTAYTGTD